MQDLMRDPYLLPDVKACGSGEIMDIHILQSTVNISRLPSYADPADIECLLTLVGLTERREWIAHLVRVEGKAAAFVLLRALRCVEDDRELLLRVARFLLRRGDALSFNVASLMRLSFGLDELRGTFSLQLQPWQLDKMEQDWAYFSRQMNF